MHRWFSRPCGTAIFAIFKQQTTTPFRLIHFNPYTPRAIKDKDKDGIAYDQEMSRPIYISLVIEYFSFFIFIFFFFNNFLVLFFVIFLVHNQFVDRAICQFGGYVGIMIRFSVRYSCHIIIFHLMDNFFILTHLEDFCKYGPTNIDVLTVVKKVVKVRRILQPSLFTIDSTRSYGVNADLFTKFTWIWIYINVIGAFWLKVIFFLLQEKLNLYVDRSTVGLMVSIV